MRRWLFLLALAGLPSGVKAACVDPAALVRSTVSIAREFSAAERQAAPGILGVRGTGWFLSRRQVVTAAHVAEAMSLSTREWKAISLHGGKSVETVPARLVQVVGSEPEKIAVLELRSAFPNAAALPIGTQPLVPEQRVLSLAYPNGELRFASGRFAQYGAGDRLTGVALLEMHDGDDRLVLDHGASGAPVLDCEGHVVAVVSTLITQTISLPTGAVRVSTAWQTPNVLAIPADVLKGLSPPE